MEKNLLEAAGYRVRGGRRRGRGLAAAARASRSTWSCPTSTCRASTASSSPRASARIPRLADLPVVLVTALESREDKERGIEVGANAYVIKSGFDQSNLLEIIRRLV